MAGGVLDGRCLRNMPAIISGQPCLSHESVPSKSKMTWLICGLGAKPAFESINWLGDTRKVRLNQLLQFRVLAQPLDQLLDFLGLAFVSQKRGIIGLHQN